MSMLSGSNIGGQSKPVQPRNFGFADNMEVSTKNKS